MSGLRKILMLFVIIGFTTACKKDDPIISKWLNNTEALYTHNSGKITITEGVAGTLTLIEGDCMPGIDPANTACKEYPVKRKIRVYEYTLPSQAESKKACVYTKVNTKLITTAICDEEGFYQVKLAPGKYSLFIEEKGELYANGSDGEGGINPVTVEAGKVSAANLRISYAVY